MGSVSEKMASPRIKESKTRAADRCFTRLRHVESVNRCLLRRAKERLKRREPAFGRRGDLRRGRPAFVPQPREHGMAGRGSACAKPRFECVVILNENGS